MAKKKTNNSIVPVAVVQKAIRNGVREIAGLDIFQVEGLRV